MVLGCQPARLGMYYPPAMWLVGDQIVSDSSWSTGFYKIECKFFKILQPFNKFKHISLLYSLVYRCGLDKMTLHIDRNKFMKFSSHANSYY